MKKFWQVLTGTVTVLLAGIVMLLEALAGGPAMKKREPRFKVGDHVRIRWRGQEGNIIDCHDGMYMISINDGRNVTTEPESQLEEAF